MGKLLPRAFSFFLSTALKNNEILKVMLWQVDLQKMLFLVIELSRLFLSVLL